MVQKLIIFVILMTPGLASAAFESCVEAVLPRAPGVAIDHRQPELLEAVRALTPSIRGNAIDQLVPVRVSRDTYLSSNKPVDELDKQLWALSRLNHGVETGIVEVVGTDGRILALGEFTIGSKESVPIRAESLFEAIEQLFAMGLTFEDIGYVGYRHVHPTTLNSGVFSWPDQMFLHQLQSDLQEKYGYRFPSQMVVIWQPNLSQLARALGGADSISKRSALAVKLYDFAHEIIGDGYVGSGGKRIPLTGAPAR